MKNHELAFHQAQTWISWYIIRLTGALYGLLAKSSDQTVDAQADLRLSNK